MFTLPLGVLGLAVGKLGRLRPHRTATSIMFASAIWIVCIAVAIHHRSFPTRALQRWTGVSFPPDATVYSHFYFGGGLADDRHVFVFTCSPEETGRLIRELKLSEQTLDEDLFSTS
jgi:hypothetical protein